MKFGTTLRLLIVLAFLLFGFVFTLNETVGPNSAHAAAAASPQSAGQCVALPLPSAVGVVEFERRLIPFLKGRCYQKWVADREIRDTGPFVAGVYYGTHPAVKVFYSPEMWDWVKKKNRHGDAADGATIIKEQFTPPASPDSPLTGWSIMVRDEKGAWDGWYWSGHSVDPKYDPQMEKFDPLKIDYKGQGFGTYCLRCHASAVAKTSTFSTARNVEEDPISYVVQVPTFLLPKDNTQLSQPLSPTALAAHEHDLSTQTVRSPHDDAHPTLPAPDAVQTAAVQKPAAFPAENFDHVHSEHKGPPQFVTSDQCIGCHTASDINMSATFMNPPVNLSPYTEWRASMMGLSGRDPIFHSQVESERAQFADSPLGNKDNFLDTKCFHCHGVMGQRQLVIDNLKPGQPLPPGGGMSPAFKHEYVYAMPGQPEAKYGALARDGVSCAVCHQMSDANPKLGTEGSFTGDFSVDKPGTMNGPYTDVQTEPMKQGLGVTPEHAPQINSSALCGSCHTVIVPVLNKEGQQLKDSKGQPLEFHEQTTYFEWLNSDYQNEPGLSNRPVKIADVQTCQDCHMPKTYAGLRVRTRVANIEDNTYPFVDFRLLDKDLTLKVRDDFSRHTLVALNVFANEMFQQFSGTLGLATGDYMYPSSANGATPVAGLVTTENSMLELARQTVSLDVVSINRTADALEVGVHVRNLTGHGFPSGVEFRRAFLELLVLDAEGRAVWASGRTNARGEIVEGLSDRVLPTEFFDFACKDPKLPPAQCRPACEQKFDPARCIQLSQPHFFGTQYPITQTDQVQIYEELVKDNDGLLTNSFVRLFEHVKDNRLLPKGWTPDGPFAEYTEPFGRATEDPGYIPADFARDRRGSEGSNTVIYRIPLKNLRAAPASVQATMRYQTIPPYYLRDRFSILGHGLADDRTRETRRLKYFTDYLNVSGTPVENWKLTIGCARRAVADGTGQLCAAP
ncbi:MAG: hypothetical protein QOH51_2872 [Acidobacteriota bacterium]|jgi:hypothetical protein|nr:hypothetical protein [Acidobacteriota bacterium]